VLEMTDGEEVKSLPTESPGMLTLGTKNARVQWMRNTWGRGGHFDLALKVSMGVRAGLGT
jgi:hypothetical protein